LNDVLFGTVGLSLRDPAPLPKAKFYFEMRSRFALAASFSLLFTVRITAVNGARLTVHRFSTGAKSPSSEK
jgi:hypothetical protein